MIPVSVVTGFLGSGKTTLISRLLRDPGFSRTAVIVNEFGEIGLDHDLIASGDETFLTLTTGCICCAVRSDLIETLLDLASRGTGQYDRVLIETSGLADPVPILQALMTDRQVLATHRIGAVVTVVDSVLGGASLARFAEAQRQVALADRLVFSKTDIRMPDEDLLEPLRALNPGAPRIFGFQPGLFDEADPVAQAGRLADIGPAPAGQAFSRGRHSDGLETISLRRPGAMPALALTLWLQALAEHCGERLIRMKGLVSIAEMPGRPAVVHGAQHVFSAPEFLPRWPSDDTDTRLVFISRDMPLHFPARLLDAIEEEVRDEISRAR